MRDQKTVLAYARQHASELEKDMHWEESEHGSGYWLATDKTHAPRIAARAAAALEFFRQYTGSESFWTRQATATYDSGGGRRSRESGARDIGALLREWSEQIEAGVVEIVGARAWVEVAVASTDIMGQVRRLVEDRGSHPAAAIVLCGAALEVALRAAVEAHDLTLEGRASIGAFAKLLRRADLLTAQDVKDLEQCAGLRNSAAHGEFDDLSRERSGLMEQQTNILLARLTHLQESPHS